MRLNKHPKIRALLDAVLFLKQNWESNLSGAAQKLAQCALDVDGDQEQLVRIDAKRITYDSLDACQRLVETIDATGGVVRHEDGTHAPVADPDWLDLGDAYVVARRVIGLPDFVPVNPGEIPRRKVFTLIHDIANSGLSVDLFNTEAERDEARRSNIVEDVIDEIGQSNVKLEGKRWVFAECSEEVSQKKKDALNLLSEGKFEEAHELLECENHYVPGEDEV